MGCGASVPADDYPHLSPPITPPFREGMPSLPLALVPPFRQRAPITQIDLNNRRQEFWATRTDGNALMWQAIKTASEAMLGGDIDLARAILVASNIITPTGSMSLCYDERGHQYKVPIYCYANPIELSEEELKPKPAAGSNKAGKFIEEKPLNVKIRINPGDINMLVEASTITTVQGLKALVCKKSIERTAENPEQSFPVCEESRQRVMLMGRELKDGTMRLGEVGLEEGRVVQVFLRSGPKNN